MQPATDLRRQKVTVPKYVQSNKSCLLCFSEGTGASPMLPQVTNATSTTWDDSDVQKHTTGPAEDSFKYRWTDMCRALDSDLVHGAVHATNLRLCQHTGWRTNGQRPPHCVADSTGAITCNDMGRAQSSTTT